MGDFDLHTSLVRFLGGSAQGHEAALRNPAPKSRQSIVNFGVNPKQEIVYWKSGYSLRQDHRKQANPFKKGEEFRIKKGHGSTVYFFGENRGKIAMRVEYYSIPNISMNFKKKWFRQNPWISHMGRSIGKNTMIWFIQLVKIFPYGSINW